MTYQDKYFMLTPLEKLEGYYIEDLAKYKTTASKKAFLTRSYKLVEEWGFDLIEAMHRPSGMLHGKFVRKIDLLHTSRELDIIENLRNTLSSWNDQSK